MRTTVQWRRSEGIPQLAGGAASDLFPSSAKIVTFKRLSERSFTANIQRFIVLFLFTKGDPKVSGISLLWAGLQ